MFFFYAKERQELFLKELNEIYQKLKAYAVGDLTETERELVALIERNS